MTIKGLRDFIKKKYPNVIKPYFLGNLSKKKLAIDIATYAFKNKIMSSDRWISNILNYYQFFKKLLIHPITCFDGKTPLLKLNTALLRSGVREKNKCKIETLSKDIYVYESTGEMSEYLLDTITSIQTKDNKTSKRLISNARNASLRNPETKSSNENTLVKQSNIKLVNGHIDVLIDRNQTITKEDRKMLKTVLKLLGFTCIKSPYEAETMACLFTKYGDVDAVLSEDSDVLAYGCKLALWDPDFKTGYCSSIAIDDLLEEMGMPYSQFLDFCILCGTDYNLNIKNIGPVKAFTLIKTHSSIEAISKLKDPKDKSKLQFDISHISYPEIRKVFQFQNYKNLKIQNICKKATYTDLNINIEKAFEFMGSHEIAYSEEKITDLWQPTFVTFKNKYESPLAKVRDVISDERNEI